MLMHKKLKTTALILIASMSLYNLPVHAVVITTEEATAPVVQSASAERVRVDTLLARGDVQQGLAAYGVSSEQAAARVAALSDEEVRQLDQRLGQAPAGGSVLGVIVFVFLVLLVTDILGLTKIFPFTRSVR